MAAPAPNFAIINQELNNLSQSTIAINHELSRIPNLINQSNIDRAIERVAERFTTEVVNQINRAKREIAADVTIQINRAKQEIAADVTTQINRAKQETEEQIRQSTETLLTKITTVYVLIEYLDIHLTYVFSVKRTPCVDYIIFMQD